MSSLCFVTTAEWGWSKAFAIFGNRRGGPGNRADRKAFILKDPDFILVVFRDADPSRPSTNLAHGDGLRGVASNPFVFGGGERDQPAVGRSVTGFPPAPGKWDLAPPAPSAARSASMVGYA